MKIGSWVIITRKNKVTAEQIFHDKVEQVITESDDIRQMISRCARSIAKDKFQDLYEEERQAAREKELRLREFIESENLAGLDDTDGFFPWEKRLVHAVIMARDFWDEMVHNWTPAQKEELDAILAKRFPKEENGEAAPQSS